MPREETRRATDIIDYIEPGKAWEMFDEALEPVRNEMERYRNLSMQREETVVLMGMFKGLHDYEKESTSEFKDWATDAPHARFSSLLEEWREGCDDTDGKREVEEFLRRETPGWSGELRGSDRPANEPATPGGRGQ